MLVIANLQRYKCAKNYQNTACITHIHSKLRQFLQRVGIACNATAVLAMALSALPPSVCPSVTCRTCVETNEATIMRFSLSGSKIILVSGEVKIVGKFAGDHL